MTDGLSASRAALESERKRNVATIATTDEEIAEMETKLGLLRNRRTYLEGRNAQLTEGIDALREVERNVVAEA